MPNIPEGAAGSAAMQFILSQGWTWRTASEPNIEVEKCPYCSTGNYHLRLEIHGSADEQKNRDGLHICMKCGKSGRLADMKSHLGITIPGVESRKDWSGGDRKIEDLPDIDACHQALLEDADAMDYLMNGRGFSRSIIEKTKLGIVPKRYFRECGEVKALVYPYLVNGNCVWAHFRTLPTMPLSENKVVKSFSSPTGWDSTLYNGEILRDGLKEVFMVEGEANCIAAMDKGVLNICGVPGANFKKAEWIDTLDKLGLEKIFICYDKDKVGQKAAQELAARIGIERCWKINLPDFDVTTDEGEHRKGKDLNEWFTVGNGTAEAFEKFKADAQLFDVDGVASSQDAVQEFWEDLMGKGVEPKYKSPWLDLNKLVGFDEGDIIDVIAAEKTGKEQSVNSKVLMSCGAFRRIGDVQVGDELASVDGLTSHVVGVFPQGKKEMFEITFSDGRKTLAGKAHLWKVCHINEPGVWRIYTTDAILGEYSKNQHGRGQKEGNVYQELYVPLISGDFGTTKELPINPWVLGALIGDGSLSAGTPKFSTSDSEMISRLNDLGINTRHIAKYDYSLAFNNLVDDLKSLDLYGKTSNTKFIPIEYLKADVEKRWELLRGLMDTDGTAGNRYGTLSYCTVSEQLAHDVVYLVRSLGGVAKVNQPQKKTFRYKGQLRQGQPAYIISIRLPDREKAFTLSRKLERIKPRTNEVRLKITHIRQVESEEAVCIAVSHPSKLYVTDDFIVTHNTTWAMNLVEHMVNTYGEDGIIICLEMTRAKLARKWVCHKAQIADNIPNTPEEAKALLEQFLTAVPQVRNMAANREGELYFASPKYKTDDDLFNLIRQVIRRYGVKWIVIDNLQLWADTTVRGKRNRTEHLSEISKGLARIGKELNVQIVRILQPHRVMEDRVVTSDNADGSSQIAKDCDCNISLHRAKIGSNKVDQVDMTIGSEQSQALDDKTLMTVGLSRYSSGGRTWLLYDGARSTFNEFSATQAAAINNELNKDVGYGAQLSKLGFPPPQTEAPAEGSGEITI